MDEYTTVNHDYFDNACNVFQELRTTTHQWPRTECI